MIQYHYNENMGILEAEYTGKILLKEILDYIHHIEASKIYPRKLKMLSNFSEAVFNFSPDDIKKIIDAISKVLKKYESIKTAIITNRPKETAMTLLYSKMANNDKHNIRVFSTFETAYAWLSV